MSEINKRTIEVLEQDVDIPDIVQQKAQAALNSIHMQVKEEKNTQTVTKKKKPKKRMIVLLIAATMVFGAVTVAGAVYMNWSTSLSEGMRATEEQKKQLEEIQMVSQIGLSDTEKGITNAEQDIAETEQDIADAEQDIVDTEQNITVTVQQSIVDNYYAYISFKIEGFELPEGAEPDFERSTVLIDGNDGHSSGDMTKSFGATREFYDGIGTADDGSVIYTDGSELQYTEDGNIIMKYIQEDGSLECILSIDGHGNKGCFLNKPIHVELQNLGTVAKAEYTGLVEATWSFDWTLTGSDKMNEYEVNVPLGDSGAVVKKVELSLLSIYTESEFPRQEVEKTFEVEDENGNITQETTTTIVRPPVLTGLKMKDGTVKPYLMGEPGITGFTPYKENTYVQTFGFDQLITIEEVDSVLFNKTDSNGEFIYGEYYEVPLS